jgi:hypothetical protein
VAAHFSTSYGTATSPHLQYILRYSCMHNNIYKIHLSYNELKVFIIKVQFGR